MHCLACCIKNEDRLMGLDFSDTQQSEINRTEWKMLQLHKSQLGIYSYLIGFVANRAQTLRRCSIGFLDANVTSTRADSPCVYLLTSHAESMRSVAQPVSQVAERIPHALFQEPRPKRHC